MIYFNYEFIYKFEEVFPMSELCICNHCNSIVINFNDKELTIVNSIRKSSKPHTSDYKANFAQDIISVGTCGSKFVYSFDSKFAESINNETIYASTGFLCPNCQKKIVCSFKNYVDIEDSLSKALKHLDAHDRVISESSAYETKILERTNGEFTPHLSLNYAELIQYLKNILNLEIDFNSITQYIGVLKQQLKSAELKHSQQIKQQSKKRDLRQKQLELSKSKLKLKIRKIEEKITTAESEIDMSSFALDIPQKPQEPIKPIIQSISEPTQPIYLTPNIFNKKKIEQQNEQLRLDYERRYQTYLTHVANNQQTLTEYNQKTQEYNIAMQEYSNAITKYNESKSKFVFEQTEILKNKYYAEIENIKLEIQSIDSEPINIPDDKENEEEQQSAYLINIFKAQLDDAIAVSEAISSTLLELYYLDVIFPKYRGLVQISTFYEYLYSQRCDKLTGPDGAYNLYESELKTNIIIGELQSINASLETIKQNQYLLYTEITNTNQLLEDLKTDVANMHKTLKEVKSLVAISNNLQKQSLELKREGNNNIAAIAQNTANIVQNTAATAYYSKLNANLTNAMGYLVALK